MSRKKRGQGNEDEQFGLVSEKDREKKKRSPSVVNDRKVNKNTEAATCLINAEIDLEIMTAEERRKQVEEWILNSEFSSFAPEMEKLFIAATRKVDLKGKDLPPETEWGLSTADAERCLTDVVRTEKFRQALKETIKAGDTVIEANVNSGDTVVEAGAGTGILAMMAAVMGARKVYAVEINPQTVKACRAFLEYCGFNQDIVEVIETDATTCDLPEQVDVILSENMYTGLFVEPQVQIINNLRRFLKPGGKIVPEKFSSYLELVEAPNLDQSTTVRNEAGIPLKSATTRAQFDVVNFVCDENLERQGMVIIRATSDTVVEAMNVSSVIDLSAHSRIDSNTCDFLGQDELVRLAAPVRLKAGELYQININYRAGCKPQDIKLTIEPAKKLRLAAAVTEEDKKAEDKKRIELETDLRAIESKIIDIDPNLIPPDEEELKKILGKIEILANNLSEAKNQGLFELFELSGFYNSLEGLFGKFKQLPLGYVDGIADRLKTVEQVLSLETKQREIEAVFDDTLESIYDLNPADQDIDLEKIKQEAPLCAAKIMKCADVLFDYSVGGTFRIDEFYSFVEKLQTYHAALQKFVVGQNVEVSEEYQSLMLNLQKQLARHMENLKDVPQILSGKIKNAMSFAEYNELSIRMTDLYVQYLKAREDNPEAVVNKKEDNNPNKYVFCEEATTKGGKRFMVELKMKKGCEFARCSNCCFATEAAVHQNINAGHISKQMDAALKDGQLSSKEGNGGLEWDRPDKADVYKFELLTPGSFFNDNEVPRDVRTKVFERLSKLPFTKIMVESRIEYLDEKEILRLKKILRPDQKLQIAIGLESANNIIREIVINKGYTLSEFEKTAEMLATNDIDLQAYSIIKPALLTEKQAQEDTIHTGQYLAQLARKIKEKTGKSEFEITLKLEQAFIQDGGFLDHLHKNGSYETPWSFTTAEIVSRMCSEGINQDIYIQIGTTNDFPPPTTVAQNRKLNNEYCPSTEEVNKALQEFNIDNDGEKFKKRIKEIQRQYPETYTVWQGLG